MAFDWDRFRQAMLDIYWGGGSTQPCPIRGKGGEDYSNQCAMRHSLATIQAGHRINTATANRFAPGAFFTYAGECLGYGANGRRLARGAVNWWNYLNTTGLMRNVYSYRRVKAPTSISNRELIPYINMKSDGNLVVDWLREGEEAFAPSRIETFDLQSISEQLYFTQANTYPEKLYKEYESMAQSWWESIGFEEKRERFVAVEGVWPRLIRKYLQGELSSPRGFVYYELGRERPSNPGFHIDGFDIEYFLDGKINHPVLGHDYSGSVPTVRIGIVR